MFPHIFIINLPEAIERRRVITEAIPPGMAYSIYAAQRGAEIGDSYTLGTHTFRRPDDLRPNEFACKMAHLSIMHHMIHVPMDCALILEDDVRIPHGFDIALQKLMQKLPADYDIVYLSYNTDMHVNINIPGIGGMYLIHDDVLCEQASITPDMDPIPYRVNQLWGTPGYLLSKAGAIKIMHWMLEHPSTTPTKVTLPLPYGQSASHKPLFNFPTGSIDLFLLANLHRLNGYASCPIIVYPNMDDSTSMIGDDRGYS